MLHIEDLGMLSIISIDYSYQCRCQSFKSVVVPDFQLILTNTSSLFHAILAVNIVLSVILQETHPHSHLMTRFLLLFSLSVSPPLSASALTPQQFGQVSTFLSVGKRLQPRCKSQDSLFHRPPDLANSNCLSDVLAQCTARGYQSRMVLPL